MQRSQAVELHKTALVIEPAAASTVEYIYYCPQWIDLIWIRRSISCKIAWKGGVWLASSYYCSAVIFSVGNFRHLAKNILEKKDSVTNSLFFFLKIRQELFLKNLTIFYFMFWILPNLAK
jgi:hypothetical protein